jgi:hypothetical protein
MRRVIPVGILAIGLLAGACSADDGEGSAQPTAQTSATSESAAAGSPDGSAGESPAQGSSAICTAIDDLHDEMTDLRDVGTGTERLQEIGDELGDVREHLQRVAAEAGAEFGDEVDGLEADFAALEDAVQTAVADPTREALRAVGSAVRTLADDVRALADEVTSTC